MLLCGKQSKQMSWRKSMFLMETTGRKDLPLYYSLHSTVLIVGTGCLFPVCILFWTRSKWEHGCSLNDETSLILFHVECIITGNKFYSLSQDAYPKDLYFISCSKTRSRGFGQSACIKHSFSSFIVPHRLRALWSLSELLNLLLLLTQRPKLGSRV